MKKWLLIVCTLAALITGCGRNKSQIVSESYHHKYGVPISKADWELNGRNGSIIELRTDGITVTRNYEKGILNGKTTYSYPNSSTLQFVEAYEAGDLRSRVENYISGVPMMEERYEKGTLMALNRWYEDGTPAAKELYENGHLLSGEYMTPLNIVEAQVIDGEGSRILRGAEGELIAKETIRNKESVEKITFFANGDPSSITPYEKGVIHGIRHTFLTGGLPNSVEEWVHGFQEGITTLFVNGEKVAEVPYIHGVKHGSERRFRDGKVVVEEVSWHVGIQHGPRTLLGEDGFPLKTEWYHQGELVSRPTFERMNLR